MNDKVLSVNDISCINVDHYEAVGILKVGHFFTSKYFQDLKMSLRDYFSGFHVGELPRTFL